MEKAFSERCKHFGLQFKPSASVELPFGTQLHNFQFLFHLRYVTHTFFDHLRLCLLGWEPGQQEGALEWDEDWDKFEDEGQLLSTHLAYLDILKVLCLF
jgi:hypothetical protein